MIDHLLWAVPELADGCRRFAERTGVIAAPGGRHPGVGLRHPRPEEMRALLAALGLEIEIEAGSAPRLAAVLETPRGDVELRS